MDLAIEVIRAKGHANITATHKTTIEVTKDDYLTPLGDCIIGVMADKSVAELSDKFKNIMLNDETTLISVFITNNSYDYIVSKGSSKLLLTNTRKIIFRKSSYIDEATIAINSNKAAVELSRKLVQDLVNGSPLTIVLIAIKP